MATQKEGARNKESVIQIRVTPELKAAAERSARADGITVTSLVTQLLMREISARK